MPLQVSDGKAALLTLDSDADLRRRIHDEAMPLLLGLAALGAIAGLLVWSLWRRTWLPLQRMLPMLQRAAHGDAFMTVRMEGSSIVKALREQINPLLHSRQ